MGGGLEIRAHRAQVMGGSLLGRSFRLCPEKPRQTVVGREKAWSCSQWLQALGAGPEPGPPSSLSCSGLSCPSSSGPSPNQLRILGPKRAGECSEMRGGPAEMHPNIHPKTPSSNRTKSSKAQKNPLPLPPHGLLSSPPLPHPQ